MDAPTEEFHAFFDHHYSELSRFAYLLLGDAEGADDLAADALVAVWRRWDRACADGEPVAYARGVVAAMARTRARSQQRERRRVALFWSHRPDRINDPDVPAVLDVRQALARLPLRKRACVVLRHAFDLSEKETARALGISVGTVKSQTSRGIAELERMLAPSRPGPEAAYRTAYRTVRVLRAGPAERSSW
ncbi:SigE family RNA polymerase sigma factor [Streptomyces sp. TRM 70361]|uniref:SigE family RNA polymerase sigma factor n=1 Tax=Streptomyces sp. TRM 70361 TaxID=3116553 RepID=UPI002E7B6FD0|nr:SigE family RNA polymerase sigma factor [Streptomyces sp. TRM 70361]MEE1941561.1 SigE family RNA polymerase sigma factor [Streptomyces sp. TRM 70361]